MNDTLKQLIDEELGECLSANELALKYAEIYACIREQLNYCMDSFVKEDEE